MTKEEKFKQALKWIACLADGQSDHFMVRQCLYGGGEDKEPCCQYTEQWTKDRSCNLGHQSCLLFQIASVIRESGALEEPDSAELADIIERCHY